MSDYNFTLSVILPNGRDARPELDELNDIILNHVDLSETMGWGSGYPELDVTTSNPSTTYAEGESRWELDGDFAALSAALEAAYPGAVLDISDTWRGDDPFSRTRQWVCGKRVPAGEDPAWTAARTALVEAISAVMAAPDPAAARAARDAALAVFDELHAAVSE